MLLAKIKIIAILSLVLLVASGNFNEAAPDTLELVHVLFRHGDRTNDLSTVYPNSPYANETYYPIGFGQLTNAGKRRMYEVGQSLKKRYGAFLGDLYTPGLIEARSSDYARTKASLLLVLAGLFPPVSVEEWNDSLQWQPIPINYKEKKHDPEFNGYYCRKYEELFEELLQSADYKQFFSPYEDLAQYLSTNTGWNVTNFGDMFSVYCALTFEEEAGFALPDWAKSVFPSPLVELAPYSYAELTWTPEFTKYIAGIMLQKILDDAYAKIRDELEPSTDIMKMHLLSGHETNCGVMLILLEVFKPHIPPYGAQIMFELHKIDGVYGYRIYYDNSSEDGPQLLKLPGCDSFCPLEQFVALYQKYLPDSPIADFC